MCEIKKRIYYKRKKMTQKMTRRVYKTNQPTMCVAVDKAVICPRNHIRDKNGKCRPMTKSEYYPVYTKPWKYFSKIEMDGWGYSIEELLRQGATQKQLINLQYDQTAVDDVYRQIRDVSFGTTRDTIKSPTIVSMGSEYPEPVGKPLLYDEEAAPDNSEEEFEETETQQAEESEPDESEEEESEPVEPEEGIENEEQEESEEEESEPEEGIENEEQEKESDSDNDDYEEETMNNENEMEPFPPSEPSPSEPFPPSEPSPSEPFPPSEPPPSQPFPPSEQPLSEPFPPSEQTQTETYDPLSEELDEIDI